MRPVPALLTLALLLAFALPANASRIGLDARNGQPDDTGDVSAGVLANGSDFDDLRALLQGQGHTLVPLSSFESADLAAANVGSVWLGHPFLQNYSDGSSGDPATFGYSSAEINALSDFVGLGGGLVLLGEGGFGSEPVPGAPPGSPGSFDATANFNQLASVFGVSFATAASENGGHVIQELDDSHPVTSGISVSAGGAGFCVDYQRQLTIASPAQDLSTLDPPLSPDNAIAAVTGAAGAGNVAIFSDSTAFKDDDVSFDFDIQDCSNLQLAAQTSTFTHGTVVPEPGTALLVGVGLLGLAWRRRAHAGASASRGPRLAAVAAAVAGAVSAPAPADALCTGTSLQCSEGAVGAAFSDPLLLGYQTTFKCVTDTEGELACKPAAGTIALLEDDRFVYWNALEGTENVELSLVSEFGTVSVNDQTRVLTLGTNDAPSWTRPAINDGGAPDGNPGGIGPSDGVNGGADGALFCSDQVHLFDGRVLAAGGTDYYDEAGTDTVSEGTEVPIVFPAGGIELEGLRDARIFDPQTDAWQSTGSMEFGRWYPTLVTRADGNVFVASGVTKLIKPVYPEAPYNSGRNVVATETYDVCAGSWSNNGTLAEKSLPLFPRLHLLPNGHIYFNAQGQAFNPFGQAYDQALWNLVSTYDPQAGTWNDIAVAGFPLALSSAGLEGIASDLNPNNPAFPGGFLTGLADTVLEDPAQLADVLDDEILAIIGDFLGMDLGDPAVVMSIMGGGFRGSTSSVMLPLVPDANGDYLQVDFLTAGGVESSIVNPSPGNYMATANVRIDTLDLSGADVTYSASLEAPLNQPRWYGSGVLLPNGQVLMASGADRDEVQTPGGGISVTRMELFDPDTRTWSLVADQIHERTYHNTAILMRDGRVLLGGHAPISTAYGSNTQIPGNSPQDGRDPSFQIYAPPYVFRDDRPVVASTSATEVVNGANLQVNVTTAAGTSFENLTLMRRTATTHLVDGDQRAVVLPVTSTDPLTGTLTVALPDANVLPAGKYMLFANATAAVDGAVVPSEGVAISIARSVACAP